MPDAITAQSLNLINAGTINGNVRGGMFGNQVELRGGSALNGGLFLGSGNDILIISNSGGGLASLISGVIDGGGGFDTLIYRFDTGVTNLATPLAQLAGFQPTGTLEIINGATVNLVSGFSSPGTLTLDTRGSIGSFNNQTALTSLGIALVGLGNLTFTNTGSITATLASSTDFALVFADVYSVTNRGTISAIGGGGVSLTSGSFANQGSITADYAAVDAQISSVTNSGTIRSYLGTGVKTSSAINSGTIFGQQVALSSSYIVTNIGTISSPHIGIEVRGVGFIDNQVGGTISGGDFAIKVDRSYNSGTFVTLTNAGRIIGNVDLTSADPSPTYNVVETRAGSSIVGNLVLGNGNDRLLVNLGASGRLAGVTGSIIGGPDSSLAYVVRQNTTSTFAPLVSAPSLFASVGFELRGGATLRLNGPAANNTSFAIGGEGTLDLNANITTNGLRSIVTDTSGAVNIITRGILTGIHTDPTKEPTAMIASSYSFGFPPATTTNLGTVIVRDRAPSASGALLAGFGGTGQIINNGLILVDGGIGVLLDSPYGYGSVINNGTIGQFSGGAGGIGIVSYNQATNNGTISTSKIGVLNLGSLTNNGTISNNGIAVQMGLAGFDGGTLNNYGLIQSSKGAAVVGKSDGYGSSFVINYATGTIKGKDGGPALTFAGTAHISNTGAIVGDVLIGQSFVPGQSYLNSSFASLGGSVKGNVQFGLSDDFFYYVGGLVSGFVDGGAGNDGITLDMLGKTTTNFDLRQYRNFEFFDLTGGGAYTLRNSSSWLGVSVGLSKLIVPATFSLSAAQTFNVNGGWAQIDGTL